MYSFLFPPDHLHMPSTCTCYLSPTIRVIK
jgi:hypothetical protein